MTSMQSSREVCLGVLLALMANTMLCAFAATSNVCSSPGLSTQFYDKRCPSFERIVQAVVTNDTKYETQMPAHLLRLLWHDCTVEVSLGTEVGGCNYLGCWLGAK
jgi:hypothetical protein